MCYVRTRSTPLTAAGKLNPPPMEGVLARSLVAPDVEEELPDREWTAVWGALAWDVGGHGPTEFEFETEA